MVDAFQDNWPDSNSEGSATVNTATTGTTAATGTMVDANALADHPASAPSAIAVGPVRLPSPTDHFLMRSSDHVVSPVSGLPAFQNLTLAQADTIPAPMPMVIPFETETEDPEARAMRAKIYQEKDVWPLESREEAMLFRHYIQKLSICVSNSIPSNCTLQKDSLPVPWFAAKARRLRPESVLRDRRASKSWHLQDPPQRHLRPRRQAPIQHFLV